MRKCRIIIKFRQSEVEENPSADWFKSEMHKWPKQEKPFNVGIVGDIP